MAMRLAQYGNYNDIKLQGAVNVPVSDTLAVRFAGNMERRDSFYDVSGPWTGNPGDRRDYSGRASILWQPSANFRLLLKGDYNNIEYGGLPAGRRATATGDPLVVAKNADLAGRDEFGRIVLNMAYTTDSGLTFRSISGFQRGTTQISYDADGTAKVGTAAAPALSFRDNISEEIWSQEFNIVSPDTGPLHLGARRLLPAATRSSSRPMAAIIRTPRRTRSRRARYRDRRHQSQDRARRVRPGRLRTDRRAAGHVGGRWSRTTSANDAVARAYFTGTSAAPLASLPQKDKTVNKKVNGKIALNWTVDPNNFLYAFVATGSKAGGLNGPNLAGARAAGIRCRGRDRFRAGLEGHLHADGHLRTQLGGYYNLYENFQVNIVDPRSPGICRRCSTCRARPSSTASKRRRRAISMASRSTSRRRCRIRSCRTFYAADPRWRHAAGGLQSRHRPGHRALRQSRRA
jgi:iron complex outermembrane receptor protein